MQRHAGLAEALDGTLERGPFLGLSIAKAMSLSLF
jgi:hypothetical protein